MYERVLMFSEFAIGDFFERKKENNFRTYSRKGAYRHHFKRDFLSVEWGETTSVVASIHFNVIGFTMPLIVLYKNNHNS